MPQLEAYEPFFSMNEKYYDLRKEGYLTSAQIVKDILRTKVKVDTSPDDFTLGLLEALGFTNIEEILLEGEICLNDIRKVDSSHYVFLFNKFVKIGFIKSDRISQPVYSAIKAHVMQTEDERFREKWIKSLACFQTKEYKELQRRITLDRMKNPEFFCSIAKGLGVTPRRVFVNQYLDELIRLFGRKYSYNHVRYLLDRYKEKLVSDFDKNGKLDFKLICSFKRKDDNEWLISYVENKAKELSACEEYAGLDEKELLKCSIENLIEEIKKMKDGNKKWSRNFRRFPRKLESAYRYLIERKERKEKIDEILNSDEWKGIKDKSEKKLIMMFIEKYFIKEDDKINGVISPQRERGYYQRDIEEIIAAYQELFGADRKTVLKKILPVRVAIPDYESREWRKHFMTPYRKLTALIRNKTCF